MQEGASNEVASAREACLKVWQKLSLCDKNSTIKNGFLNRLYNHQMGLSVFR